MYLVILIGYSCHQSITMANSDITQSTASLNYFNTIMHIPMNHIIVIYIEPYYRYDQI